MKNIYSLIIFVLSSSVIFGQVLITETATTNTPLQLPHASAMLEIRSNNKGVLLPTVNLTSPTDVTTVQTPTEGTVVYNLSTNVTQPLIPTTKPALALWDGSKWLFAYSKENVVLDLDKVRSYIADNGNTVVDITSFPGTDPAGFTEGSGLTGWSTLITTTQASFEFAPSAATQKLVVDVEGVSAIDTDANFTYAVGIFVEDKLVSVQKYLSPVLTGTSSCLFQKFNIRAILDDATVLNKPANALYNVKVAVRALQRPSNDYANLRFGNSVSGCSNLNAGTARTYMNILTIERRN